MKKIIIIFLMAFSLLFLTNATFAQSNPPADHGNRKPVRWRSSIGGGCLSCLVLVLLMVARNCTTNGKYPGKAEQAGDKFKYLNN